jgi:hypothetical protein
LLQLKALLVPFGIRRFYTDGWCTYRRHLAPDQHVVGKRRTQQLERKHLTLRTRIKRLVRKTICFSRSVPMHDIVIGLFINRFEFGLASKLGTSTELAHHLNGNTFFASLYQLDSTSTPTIPAQVAPGTLFVHPRSSLRSVP